MRMYPSHMLDPNISIRLSTQICYCTFSFLNNLFFKFCSLCWVCFLLMHHPVSLTGVYPRLHPLVGLQYYTCGKLEWLELNLLFLVFPFNLKISLGIWFQVFMIILVTQPISESRWAVYCISSFASIIPVACPCN